MKALVLQDICQLVMRDVPVPSPGPGQLLIKTKAATVCTSDLSDIRYNHFGIPLPVVMGHEGSGVVVEVGEGVVGFKEGDEVTAHSVVPCGECDSCRRGFGHLCNDMGHLGINMGGVFAEYFLMRSDRVRKKPPELSFAAATLLEPVCVCLEALERANVHKDRNVLIIGDGPFGIITARLAQALSPARVILTGRHPFRMELAKNAIIINERESSDIQADILSASGGEGIDSAILCVGTAQAVDTAIAALRTRGTLAVFSAVQPAPTVDLFRLHVKELSIRGSCNDLEMIDTALERLCDKSLMLNELVTHLLPFDEWENAFRFAEFGKGEAVKVTMVFD